MKLSACIHWLWSTSHDIRLRIVLSGFSGIFHVCASLAFVWVSKRMVDIATFKAEGDVWHYTALMAACIAVQLSCSVAGSRLDLLNAVRFKNKLRYRLFTRIMASRPIGKGQLHTGEILNRMEEDTRIVTEVLCTTLPSVIATIVQLVAAFGFLWVLEPMLALMLAGIMPVALLLSKVYLRRMRRLTGEIRTAEGSIQSHVQEYLQHRMLIRCMERTPDTLATLEGMQSTLHDKVRHRTDFTLFSRTLVQVGFAAGYTTAFVWSIHGLMSGAVTFGLMTAFLQLVAQVQRPVVELSRYLPLFIQSVTSVERLAELDHLPVEVHGDAVFLQGAVGVKLEGVWFSYGSDYRHVIRDFTYNFAPGSFTALVGETGAGKSTLIRLMLALLTPEKGRVVFYNDSQEAIASPLTRCNLIYVPQGNTLLSGSVRDNLLLGNPEATETQLRTVLHTAAAEFVFELPDGLDTLCSEGGTGLSEGQAQRIAIARGLLRPGSILLLDEPTSSLDSDTELALIERLAAHAGTKTILLVTHRQAAARYAAEIVTLQIP